MTPLPRTLKIQFPIGNEGIFFEAVTNKICDDLGAVLVPRALTIVADWKGRVSVFCGWVRGVAKIPVRNFRVALLIE